MNDNYTYTTKFDDKCFLDNIIWAIDFVKKTIKEKEEKIFDYFKVEVPDGYVLFLPNKYKEIIGYVSNRIRYSSLLTNYVLIIKMDLANGGIVDTGYWQDKSVCEI